MPASRRARAMILAPRSWPSRPGLATTTRIFFDVLIGGSLEDRALPVGAEHPLEGRDDLALGGVRAGGVEQGRHQVLVLARGGLAQDVQRRLHRGAVARGAGRLHASDLLALERVV